MTEQELIELGKDPHKLLTETGKLIIGLRQIATENKSGLEARNVDLALLGGGFTIALELDGGMGIEVSLFLKTILSAAYLMGRQDESEATILLKQIAEPVKVTAEKQPWPKEEN